MYHSTWKVSEGYYIINMLLGRVFIKGWNWNYNIIIYKKNKKTLTNFDWKFMQ